MSQTASEVDEFAPAYRLEINGLYDLTAAIVEELQLPYPKDQGGHPFKHTPHSLILALRDKVKALASQPRCTTPTQCELRAAKEGL
jgi:hypothetical protein